MNSFFPCWFRPVFSFLLFLVNRVFNFFLIFVVEDIPVISELLLKRFMAFLIFIVSLLQYMFVPQTIYIICTSSWLEYRIIHPFLYTCNVLDINTFRKFLLISSNWCPPKFDSEKKNPFEFLFFFCEAKLSLVDLIYYILWILYIQVW